MSIALIDFSSLFYRLWHVDREQASFKCLSFLNLLTQYDEVIICVDSPPYRRKDIDANYKANRDVPDPELIGQLRESIRKALEAGYAIASADGWEADDVIATMCKQSQETVTVYGTDKDLLQCSDLTVPFTNEIKTPESTLGVSREQVVDYLCMTGDKSDNVKGIEGIGPVTACKMLTKFGSLAGMLDAIKKKPSLFSEKTANAIMESLAWIDITRKLITLNSELEIKLETKGASVVDAEFTTEAETVQHEQDIEISKNTQIQNVQETQYIVKTDTVDYRRALEPVGIGGQHGAFNFAIMAHKSALYPKFKSPEQCLMAVMRGRAFGLDATTSLDAIEMIQGKPTLKAQLVAGIIMASPKCEFLECANLSCESCTWETKRIGNRKDQSRTFTIKDAEKLGLSKKDNWIKQPDVMLQWRCLMAIARQVYPDVTLGIYDKDELE